MIDKLTHTTVWVLDQDEAKGLLGPGAFETSDCRSTYTQLSERGVTFLSEPTRRPWGTEATRRDNSGNWFSMTER